MGKPERRQQLLNVACDVFVRSGYHAAKVDDIVAAAGVARGTFYLYFEDKRDIFEALVDTAMARASAAMGAPEVHRPEPADPFACVIQRLTRILLDDPGTTKILLSDALGVDPAFDRKLLSFFDQMTSLVEHSLRERHDRGGVQVTRDVHLRAWLAIGALKEVILHVVGRGAEFREEDLVKGVLHFLRIPE